jgi:hypothetical protein
MYRSWGVAAVPLVSRPWQDLVAFEPANLRVAEAGGIYAAAYMAPPPLPKIRCRCPDLPLDTI